MPVISAPSPIASGRERMVVITVLQELERLHSELRAGETFPSRRELMERLNASEHVVRGALDVLERQGKIIRRVGRGGSIVADLSARRDDVAFGAGPHGHASMAPFAGAGAREALEHSVLAIGEPDGGIFDQAMRVLMKQAKSAKLVVHCRFVQQEEVDYFQVPSLDHGPRKFVVFRRHYLPLAARIQASGHRVVLIGTPYGTEMDPEVPTVFGDQEHGGYLAAQHLLDLGHRRLVLHISGDYPNLRRWEGWRRAIEEARESGLDVRDEVLDVGINGQWRQRDDLVRAYFSRPDAPTAIASWNDNFAIELLTLLQRSGLRVPEDVSLIGYDNISRGAELHPALSTVDGALDIQIQAALRLLKQQKLAPTHQTVVVPTLVPRESTAPPKR